MIIQIDVDRDQLREARKSSRVKLTGHDEQIVQLRRQGLSLTRTARRLKVHRLTLAKYIRDTSLQEAIND